MWRAGPKGGEPIPVGSKPTAVAITPDDASAYVMNQGDGKVSTIDVATRTKHPDDIPAFDSPRGVAITPDGRTAFFANALGTGVDD